MSCCDPVPRRETGPSAKKKVAVVGMPNTGKSTFFNRLTGAGARVGNWPGVTVDLLAAKILLGADMVEVVDLPGMYNLHGFSDDEQAVRHFLENNSVNMLLVILNATQLDRQLALVLQLKELGLPMVLALNMMDEAQKAGIFVDAAALSKKLDMPVSMFSAKYGQGFPIVKQAMEEALRNSEQRFADPEALAHDDDIESELEALVASTVQVPVTASEDFTAKLDRVLLHPLLGLPLFFLVMYLMFEAVYAIGTPLQDGVAWVLETIKVSLLEPLLAGTPTGVQSFLLEGLYDGVGTVASFLPIIVTFFLAMALVEDSGYLSRAAFLMDALMSKLGLDGRSFVMQLMGFGCNVPAIMGTRVMRSRALRLLTMLIIPFSLCSARLQVFLFFTTAVFSPKAAPLVIFSLYLFSFAAAFLSALLFRRRLTNDDPLLLEMPPYRMPTFRQMLMRGWRESKHFLTRATGFIILGVVLVWFLTHYPFSVEPASSHTLAGIIADWMQPFFAPLGITTLLSIALLFGFVAKEVVIGALAVIYAASGDQLAHTIAGNIDWVQGYSFMLFTLLYTPCLSTVAVLKQESKSWKFTGFSVFWSLAVAWVVSFLFYQGARLLLG